MTDFAEVRRDFPILAREVCGRPIVYFDNAATSLKPTVVIEAVVGYMERYTANIHRGKHFLSDEASEIYERTRQRAARFVNGTTNETILTSGTTESINLVAEGLGLSKEDNVVGTVLEHHSNILPWRARCEYRGAGLTASGQPSLEEAQRLIDGRTRLVTVTHCSNVTGVHVPVRAWADLAHRHDLRLFVDAAQSAPHFRIDVAEFDCDYLAFSAHKMCGPTGAGVLYGKREALEALAVRKLGGGAVTEVRSDFSYRLRELPWRLESGTPDIAAVAGFGAALDYLEGLGMDAIDRHNRALRGALDRAVAGVAGIRSFAAPTLDRASILAFALPSAMPSDDLSRVFSDNFGIMVRGGHHCAHPLHAVLGAAGSLRASLQFYNTEEEIDYFGRSLARLVDLARLR
jgi:cysteine desulfurase/selenocysteine lyase